MLLVGHHGLDQLHGPAQAQIAGIDAEVVAVHTAPLLGGIVLVIGRPALVGLEDQLAGLLRREVLPLGHALDTDLQRCADKQAQVVGIVRQGVVRAPADDNAGPLVRDVPDGVESRQIHLLFQRVTHTAAGQ